MSLDRTLTSKRLIYKPITKNYCSNTYLNWLNDKEVTRYLEIFEPYTLHQLEKYLDDAERNKELLFWAIHLKQNDKHIGNIKIDPINRYHELGEYGIMMGDKSEWGKGYAEEASIAIIDYCFIHENLRKINLGVVEENAAAVNLYKKLGFVIEGKYRNHGFYNGHYCDVLRMALFNPHR
jgi:RimJ/RimL family protein N-acetyltransferase